MPASLAGLVFFVVLLAPGLAYVLRHERVVPAPQHSAFRETLRVIFVSVGCLLVTGLAMAALRWRLPQHTPDVGALIRDPVGAARAGYVELMWWAIALVLFATLLGALAADPRVVSLRRRMRSTRVALWAFGGTQIHDVSGWRMVFKERRAEEERSRGIAKLEVLVGIQLLDGSYVRGYLVTYNPKIQEDDQREITLTRAEIRNAGKDRMHPIGSTLTVISARQIARIDVTYINPPSSPPRHRPQTIAG